MGSAQFAGSAQQITYEIILDAKAAISALRDLQTTGASVDETITALGNQIKTSALNADVPWEMVLEIFKAVNTELAKTNSALLDTSKSAAGTGAAMRDIFSGVKESLNGGTEEATSFFNVSNMIKMALGEIQAIVIFQLYQAVVGTFQDAVKAADQYYQSLLQISVAQDTLARSGVATTNQQLLQMADELAQKFQTFSKVDMANAVAQASLLASNYGMSVNQVQQLTEMAALLARLHGGMPADYVDNILKASEGTKALWAFGQQVVITNDQILAKAKEMGLVAQDFKGTLDENTKATAGFQLLWERLSPEIDQVAKSQDNVRTSQQQLAATWKDSLTQLGVLFAPILGSLADMATRLLKLDQAWGSGVINTFIQANVYLGTVLLGVIKTLKALDDALHGHFEAIQNISDLWKNAYQSASDYFNNLYRQGGIGGSNTPVSPGGGTTTAAAAPPTPSQSELDDAANAYQSYYDQVEKATEAFNQRMQDLQDQYNLNVQKEMENTALRISEEQQSFHLKVQEEERAHQEKMRELQAQYLLDLEDALRKRDAEAVIKIIEKYQNEKTTANQQEKIKLQDMKAEEQLRIKQMKEEEALRLKQMAEEFALQKKMETEHYNQQLADYKSALDTKLQELAVKIAQEHNMNQSGMEALYNLFTEYYGSNGKFAKEQQGSYLKMEEQSQGFVDAMSAIYAQYANTLAGMAAAIGGSISSLVGTTATGSYRGAGGTTTTPQGSGSGGGGMSIPHHMASGGVALAGTATTATFGEAGPELAMFLPLNASTGRLPAYGFGGGGGGGGGVALIRLEVGSDLEARIVNNALTQAALSIEKVYRSR
jgi:hypothetical protein